MRNLVRIRTIWLLLLFTFGFVVVVCILTVLANLYRNGGGTIRNVLLVANGFLVLLLGWWISRYRPLAVIRILYILRSTRPRPLSDVTLLDLGSNVKVSFDSSGVPLIEAENRKDAIYVLGYLMARDRLFQMDLLRRTASGRLAEVLGATQLENDRKARVIGFHRIVSEILENLPFDQQEVLEVYARGVNSYIERESLPFEFRLCGYKPEPWTAESGLLVFMEIYKRLCGDGKDKRMLTLMEEVLPPEVVAFFVTDEDEYTTTMVGGEEPLRPSGNIPKEALVRLIRSWKRLGQEKVKSSVPLFTPPIGSNQWAVSGERTFDGRAIISNDMHLELGMPNIWYRACLKYENSVMCGVFLPGAMIMVAGSNGHVGWGFTRMCGDNLDLVRLKVNPNQPQEYQTPEGWEPFREIDEVILVKGGKDVIHKVKVTRWGPVYGEPLLGDELVLRWTALSPDGVDLGLIQMDAVRTIEEGIDVMTRWAGPPLNVMMADQSGHIAWTLCGKFPSRRGFDGYTATSWADPAIGWDGYIPSTELPRVIDPPEGLLLTANNRILGSKYPHRLGFNFCGGYRAYRIQKRLLEMSSVDERDMHELQLNVDAEFYRFYQKIALEALDQMEGKVRAGKLKSLRRALNAWDGRVHKNSKGIPLVFLFHQRLTQDVLDPFFGSCRELDPSFRFLWVNYEKPLRAILAQKDVELFNTDCVSWAEYLFQILAGCAHELMFSSRKLKLDAVTWGDVNQSFIVHPLSFLFPELWSLLNIPHQGMDGCLHSINASWAGFGVSERYAVSPGHEREGTFAMPGGQSSHPLSIHYDDHHKDWMQGTYSSFYPGEPVYIINFQKKSSIKRSQITV